MEGGEEGSGRRGARPGSRRERPRLCVGGGGGEVELWRAGGWAGWAL